MKSSKKKAWSLLLLSFGLLLNYNLTSCRSINSSTEIPSNTSENTSDLSSDTNLPQIIISFEEGDTYSMEVGSSHALRIKTENVPEDGYKLVSSDPSIVKFTSKLTIQALKAGECDIICTYLNIEVKLHIIVTQTLNLVMSSEERMFLIGDKTELFFNENIDVNTLTFKGNDESIYDIKIDKEHVYFIALKEGECNLTAYYEGNKSNSLSFTIYSENPYNEINLKEFYEEYTPAISPNDAKFRTECELMSGDISEQDQKPTTASNQPKKDDKFIRNNYYGFSPSGLTYTVIDADGNDAFSVYKDGAYVTLEEVAAYIFAFGDVPANYWEDRHSYPQPDECGWGKFLRLNNSYFSGNTDKYPYEPELPDISGIDGNLDYYEVDIGTTGTDCDPKYPAREYNNGKTIDRGAARICYVRCHADGSELNSLDERYVFYTYNHYNDFQEYLNYQGGWGEMFGNITGGGTISSKTHYNPTPYVESILASLRK